MPQNRIFGPLREIISGDKNIFGLEITMDDAIFVRGGEALSDLRAVFDRLALRQCAMIEHGAEAFTRSSETR